MLVIVSKHHKPSVGCGPLSFGGDLRTFVSGRMGRTHKTTEHRRPPYLATAFATPEEMAKAQSTSVPSSPHNASQTQIQLQKKRCPPLAWRLKMGWLPSVHCCIQPEILPELAVLTAFWAGSWLPQWLPIFLFYRPPLSPSSIYFAGADA